MYGCCSLTLCVLGQVPPGREADFQFSSQEGLNVSMREAALSREARSPQYATLCYTVLCCVVMFAGDRSAGRLQEAAGRVSAPSLYVCVA